jgi:hypothetical protein
LSLLTPVLSTRLDFLGPGFLATKTLVYGGWKSLDFLGFSRPNRALSTGYTGFSLKEISRALSRSGGRAGLGRQHFYCAEAQDFS